MRKPDRPLAAIERRCSIRNYTGEPLSDSVRAALGNLLEGVHLGPFGNPVRLELIAAGKDNASDLKGLHTYGMIKGACAYLLGAVGEGHKNLEDCGYVLELADLHLSELGLGSCWLGGTFTKSGFAKRMGLVEGEEMPCAISLGPIDAANGIDRVADRLKSRKRLPWEETFFDGDFKTPLPPDKAGPFKAALAAVRASPSATSKQPWRVVRAGESWHFYLQRSMVYGKGGRHLRLVGLSDLQRVDMGIALSHFQLAAEEEGFAGRFIDRDPGLALPGWGKEYCATWEPIAK